jgi:tetratricopeptide (TPR) repeat protein
LRVPLLLKLPGSARGGEAIARPVGLIDVAPTIASLLGLDPPFHFRGASVLAKESGGGIYSETYYPRIHLGWSELRSLIDARYHLIDGPKPELYDVRDDASERSNLFLARQSLGSAMRNELGQLLGRFQAPAPADPETLEKLRSLGYLGGVAEVRPSGTLPNPRDHVGEIEDIKKGFALAASGRNLESLGVLRGLLDKNSDIFDVRLKEGEVLLALGRPEEALQSLKKAVQISPSLAAGVAPALARANLELGNFGDADQSARIALKTNPPEGHILLAQIALKRDDLSSAEHEAAWLRQNPKTAQDGALAAAEVRIRQERFEDALRILDEVKGQTLFNLEFLRGDALARLSHLPEAERAFRAEVKAFSTNSEAYARLAIVCALQRHRVAEVDQVLEEMEAASPGPATERLAAKTLDSLGDHVGAARWLRKARIHGGQSGRS